MAASILFLILIVGFFALIQHGQELLLVPYLGCLLFILYYVSLEKKMKNEIIDNKLCATLTIYKN